MKLYLASNGFPTRSQFKQLVGKDCGAARVAVIMNACDWRTVTERRVRYREMRARFKKLGIKPDVVDLRKFYRKSRTNLINKLMRYDLLWVRGGNSYFLRYVMKRSSFDEAIKIALAKGLVYAGQSAGSLVMGPTLKYIDRADDPGIAPRVVWQGIGLVKVVPLPHWQSPLIKKEIAYAFRSLRRDGKKVVRLRDTEALLVVGRRLSKVRVRSIWK